MRSLPDIVLFDLDGTLVDSAPGLQTTLNVVLAEHGRRPLSLDEVHRFVGEGLDTLLARALAATGPALEPGPLRARWFQVYQDKAVQGSRAYPFAGALLRSLTDQGCRLGLVTNKPQAPAEQILRALGWAPHFEVVLGGDALPRRKPDPAPLREALGRLPPGRAAFVGDSAIDVQAARAADLPMVLLRHGYCQQDPDSLGAHAVVSGLDEVEAALRGL
jgi:phosphoglycolate phosphatase